MEYNTRLYEKNPEAYQAGLAISQLSLGALYTDIGDYPKAEDYCLKSLENYTQLFHQDPDAYRSYVAQTQSNLGALYYRTGDSTKAEFYMLKSVRNYFHQFNRYPDVFRTNLCDAYNNLVSIYVEQKDYDKTMETIEQAIDLMPEEADFYESKGEILMKKGDEQGAREMWQKVMELDPDFLSKNGESSELYQMLKGRGLLK